MAIVKVFLDTPMGLGIPGLTKLLEENNIAIQAVQTNSMFMFLNRKRTQVKIMWGGLYMLHLRKDVEQWSIDELKKVPAFFRQGFLTDKIESQLKKYINKTVNVTLDEHGIKVS